MPRSNTSLCPVRIESFPWRRVFLTAPGVTALSAARISAAGGAYFEVGSEAPAGHRHESDKYFRAKHSVKGLAGVTLLFWKRFICNDYRTCRCHWERLGLTVSF